MVVAAAGPPLVARFLGCGVARDASVPVASCAALAVDRRLRLPLADDLRRYTFTVYLLHVLPVGLLRGLLYPRLAVDPALFSALLFLSGVLIPWAVGRMARRWIPSSTAGGRLSLRLLGL